MSDKYWVDYINHRNVRAWRPVEIMFYSVAMYPPVDVAYDFDRSYQPCLMVKMLDRNGEDRTLSLMRCREFRPWFETKPTTFNAREELERISVDRLGVASPVRVDALKFLVEHP